jgi:hypothetical protein
MIYWKWVSACQGWLNNGYFDWYLLKIDGKYPLVVGAENAVCYPHSPNSSKVFVLRVERMFQ